VSPAALAVAVGVAVGAMLGAGCGPRAVPPGPAPPAKTLQLNTDGEHVDLEAALVPGHVTLVDFWSESCGACIPVAGRIAVAIAHDDRIVVRKIDVGDGFTPVARAYDIGALPQWNVYDRHRRLRYVLRGSDCLRAPALARELLAEP
jgi:thiol-disulfide isomerase/thioredoxin